MLIALSGCSGTNNDADPTASYPSGTTPSVSAAATTHSPPPTTAAAYQPATAEGPAQNVPVPVLPEKAKEFSKEGLIAFAEYWYSTLGYAYETGDAGPMMAISGPDCGNCAGAKKSTTSGHSDGKWIVGGLMYVSSTDTSFAPLDDGTFQIIAMVRQDKVQYYKADKELSKDLGTTISAPDILIATYQDNNWIAQKVAHLEGRKGP
ncbi:DUF6318 family protein [Arthrobacter sp. LAPM80]|uniref:DUF6318 family protein n=1 Tax=Arthrobacter sp. LAPM80 TaxID=3141788 RepID=UPI00398B7BC3